MEKSSLQQFQQLFEQFHPMLVTYAWGFVKSKDDAREIVQDVFVAIWKKRETLTFDASLRAYLFKATKNKCLSFLQKKRISTVKNDLSDFQDKLIHDAEAEHDAAEIRAIIFQEVNKLPPKCKQIFLLSRQKGLSNKEIAQKLDLSTKTVENQMTIALKKLRAYLTTLNLL